MYHNKPIVIHLTMIRLAFLLLVVFYMSMFFSCTRQKSPQSPQKSGVQNNSPINPTKTEPVEIVNNIQKQKHALRDTASFEMDKNQQATQTEVSQKALVINPSIEFNSAKKVEISDISNSQISEPVNQQENNSKKENQRKAIDLCCDYWIEAGSGINFYTYDQTYNSVSDIKFSKIDTQHTYYRTGFNLHDKIDLNLYYHKSMSSIKNGVSISVDSGSFVHQIMTATLNYSLKKNKEDSWFELILGLNQESLPFVVPIGTNTITTYQINKTNAITGLQYSKQKNDKTKLYSSLSFNIPFAQTLNYGQSFSEKNSYSLTASLGTKHKFKPNLYFNSGLSAYYSSQNFSYLVSNSSQSGKQQYFFINFNFGVGYEF